VAAFKKLVTAEIVDAVDEDGYTLLANVVLDEDADAERARYLIELGAAINRVGAADEKWTALALALRDGRTEIARMLLDSAAKPANKKPAAAKSRLRGKKSATRRTKATMKRTKRKVT
jgi:ankyrin repeat protein